MASKTYETPPPSPGLDPTFSNQPVPPDAVRMVGIRKTAGEHLVSKRELSHAAHLPFLLCLAASRGAEVGPGKVQGL